MLNSIRKFSKTFYARILLIIIIIPFVFWGMGGVFNTGNTNNLAKIDNENISTQDLVDYINNMGINPQVIKNNINNNIIEELLTEIISRKLLNMEVSSLNLNISEETLKSRIINNKKFHENDTFSRLKYEKFLLSNNTNAPDFEKKLKENEIQKNLFSYINGGLYLPKFLNKRNYENNTRKVDISYLSLDNLYTNEFTIDDIDEYINKNQDNLMGEHIDFSYSKITPNNLIENAEFDELFFKKIDQIENKLFEGSSLKDVLSGTKVDIVDKRNFSSYNKGSKIENEIYNNRKLSLNGLIDKNEFIIAYEIKKIEKKLPKADDTNFRKKILDLLANTNKYEKNKKIFEKINTNKFKREDFNNISSEIKTPIKKHVIKSKRDNMKFTIDSIKLIYSLPTNSFLLVNDDKNNIYLVKINNFLISNPKNEKNLKNYNLETRKEISESLFTSYDLYLNKKYNIKINYNTVERMREYFK